ncbi:hypothetical protein SIM22_05905 [Bacillus cereus group sp. BfR-BA-01363]|uniref:hypothetical protein n=1 Tax=Bacillus cereus group sp. BfR-BA-01363 TaxID=3094882 RepID=UPI0029C396EC|nr:hypothetical protein [Bacillus cereus group sp. BfR-BA-01363]MDX5853637.1 hypothetical protein [Bacillus cereus group sp. BfR-BA-01363]
MKPRKTVPMTESDRIDLEDYLRQVLPTDNDSLLSHYTGAVRTYETDEQAKEYFAVMIDRLYEEILKRMK